MPPQVEVEFAVSSELKLVGSNRYSQSISVMIYLLIWILVSFQDGLYLLNMTDVVSELSLDIYSAPHH